MINKQIHKWINKEAKQGTQLAAYTVHQGTNQYFEMTDFF